MAPVKWKIETPKESAKFINILIYGRPGAGKTTLAASAADVDEMRDVLFVDIESGSSSVVSTNVQDVLRISNFDEISEIHTFLAAMCKARDSSDPEGNLKKVSAKFFGDPEAVTKFYNTVVIDTLSELQRLNMYKILGIDMDNLAMDDEWEQLEFSHWNKTTNMMRIVTRGFRNLPMHTIFTSHEVEDEKRKKVTIAFPNALRSEIPGFVDMVGYLRASNSIDANGIVTTERRLELEDSRKYLAKHRLGKALEGRSGIADPTMKKLFDIRQMAD
jgi:hypothetical protein